MSRSCVVLLAVVAFACTDNTKTAVEPGNGDSDNSNIGGDSIGGSASRYRSLTFTFDIVDGNTSALSAGYQGKLLRGSDGTLYYAYFKYLGNNVASCNIAAFGGGAAPNLSYDLRVGVRPPGGTWTHESVSLASVGPPNYADSLFGIDGTLDGSGRPTFALAAGGPGLFTCGSSDLVLATRTGTNAYTVTNPVVDSSGCCNDGVTDPASVQGTNVGAWAAIARDSNNAIAVAYTDHHNFADEDGQTYQGFELYRASGGVSGILPWSGEGAFSSMVFRGGVAVTAFTRYNGTDLRVAYRVADTGALSDWVAVTPRPGVTVGERISMAVAPNGNIGIAYHERLSTSGSAVNDIVYLESADAGVTWTGGEQVYTALVYTRMPSLAFDSDSHPLVSFQSCGGNTSCQAPNDGLRLAWKNDGGRWESIEVVASAASPDGAFSSLVVDPDTGVPTIAYQDLGIGAAMSATGHFPGGT